MRTPSRVTRNRFERDRTEQLSKSQSRVIVCPFAIVNSRSAKWYLAQRLQGDRNPLTYANGRGVSRRVNATGMRAKVVIFSVALGVMLLEVALTRLFSFVTFHHMTYLVIGVAMLGFGAAGTRLMVRTPDPDPATAAARLARRAAYFAAATLVGLLLIPHIRFYPIDVYSFGSASNLAALLAVILLAAGPFYFAGLCIAELIGGAGAQVGGMYFADLLGSAAGSLLSIALINSIGALAAAALAGSSALVAAAVAAPRKRIAYVAGALLVAAFAPVVERPGVLPLTVPPGKHLFGNEWSIETVKWHVITRLDVSRPIDCPCSFGGALSPIYTGPMPLMRMVYQDGSNLTGIIGLTPTPEQTPVLGQYLQGAAFRLRPAADALVIGSGGGVDVMIGLHHGARHIVAVDVNPKMMGLVRGQYAGFAGNVFNGPAVEPVVSEGRHFLSRDRRQFDVIQLSGVDTWAALSSGAIALTENFIYTAEAFDQYLDHLSPQGILGFSRPYGDPSLETFRLSATALDALERRGVEKPWRHLLVLAGHGSLTPTWAELLVKRSPFTEQEVEQIEDWSTSLGFFTVFDPLVPGELPIDDLARRDHFARRRMIARYPLDIRPATDDRPFYFQYHDWSDLFGRPPLGLRPPGAMWVCVMSLAQVALLSALFILYPLRRRNSEAHASGGRLGVFAYFASLGLGFILVEIALMSKLTVFLGGPAYALAITLFGLLLASALGSLLSQRRAARPLALLVPVIAAIFTLIVAEALFIDAITARLMGLNLAGRVVATALLIGPLGLLLGVPFPAGLRLLDATRPELKPWAWGINACATVVGTSSCMMLATAYGFRAALFVAAAAYALGFAALRAARLAPVPQAVQATSAAAVEAG